MAQVLELQVQISPSNEYSGLISFRVDWFDLLAVQGTFENLFQHHILKASALQCSALFMVQLSHLYVTTSKTIALTIRTFVGKAMFLLFNRLSKFILTFLSRSLCLVAQSCPTLCDPMDYPTRLLCPWGFSRQEYWSGLPFPPPGVPRSKCLLISWLQSPSAVILQPKKMKSLTVSIVSPSICHEMLETYLYTNIQCVLIYYWHLVM